MTLELAATVLGALTIFLIVGLMTGQTGATRQRVMDRALRLERRRLHAEAVQEGDDLHAGLLREDAVASRPRLSAFLRRVRWSERRAATLAQANIPLKVSEYALVLLVTFLVLTAGGALLTGFLLAGPLVGVAGVVVAEVIVTRRASKRLEQFNEQLPDALQMMASSLESGFAIMEAIRIVGREMEPPISDEFRHILEATRAGGSFEDGMGRLADRIGGGDMRLVTEALAIHRQVGGNLGEILAQVAKTARERQELRRHIRSLTAQERVSAIIVATLPVWVVGLFFLMAPELVRPLWEDSIGLLLLGVAVVLELVGFLVMRRVMTIEV